MTKSTTFATAAAIFAVSTFATASFTWVPCIGANARKGQGFVNAGSSFECTVLKSK